MEQVNYVYVIGAIAVALVLAAWLAWIAVPAWKSYARWWERIVALTLSVYILAAFVIAGVAAGAAMLLYTRAF